MTNEIRVNIIDQFSDLKNITKMDMITELLQNIKSNLLVDREGITDLLDEMTEALHRIKDEIGDHKYTCEDSGEKLSSFDYIFEIMDDILMIHMNSTYDEIES